MQTVKITRATVAAGQRVEAGAKIDLPAAEAKTLIAMGKALPVGQAEPVIDNRDDEKTTETNKRSKKKKSGD